MNLQNEPDWAVHADANADGNSVPPDHAVRCRGGDHSLSRGQSAQPHAEPEVASRDQHGSLLEAAIEYWARGWSIVPVRKMPTWRRQSLEIADRFRQPRLTEAELHDAFKNEAGLDALAVVLGDVSGGLVCLTFGTIDAYRRWETAYPALAATLPTVETAIGREVYLRSTWRGHIRLGYGELLGESSEHCLLPPSRELSGETRQWLVPLPDGELPVLCPEAIGVKTQPCDETRKSDPGIALLVRSTSGDLPTIDATSVCPKPPDREPPGESDAANKTTPGKSSQQPAGLEVISADPSASFLAAALEYNARDWCIIPIRHKPDTGGKQAAVAWKQFQQRRPSESELRGWFGSERKLDGLAVVLGAVSGGLACRDYDQPDAYQRWASAHPALAKTLPTVRTARGWHVYFRSPCADFVNLGDGEMRADSNHYCLLPPSLHPSGAAYRWVVPVPDGELPVLDEGLAEKPPGSELSEEHKSNTTGGGSSVTSNFSDLSVSPPPSQQLLAQIEAAIATTLPKEIGERNRAVFELARALKGIPTVAQAAAGTVRNIVAQWHHRALPVIGTKPFEDTWADFVFAWPKVQFPRGQDPLAVAVERARNAPLPRVAEQYEAPEMRLLVSLCHELQLSSGSRPFFLSVGIAARVTGLPPLTAWRRLKLLEAEGVLLVVQPGTKRQATRYRYLGGD